MRAYRMEDLSIWFHIGRSFPTGAYEITRKKTRRVVLAFKEIYKCSVGEIAPEEWKEIATLCVKVSGSGTLLSRIEEHCRTHCTWLKTEKDRKEYALNILVGRTYRYWEDFSAAGLSERSAFVFEFEEGLA